MISFSNLYLSEIELPCKKSAVRLRILEWIYAYKPLVHEYCEGRKKQAYLRGLDMIVEVIAECLDM